MMLLMQRFGVEVIIVTMSARLLAPALGRAIRPGARSGCSRRASDIWQDLFHSSPPPNYHSISLSIIKS